MGLREIYDHPTFDKGNSESSSEKVDNREHSERDPHGGEIGKSIKVRDSTERSEHESNPSKSEHHIPENHQKEKEDNITRERDSSRSPVEKGDKDHSQGGIEKHFHAADSDMAKVAKKFAYILKQGYAQNINEVENVIRCGNSICNSFGPPKNTKEMKKDGKRFLKELGKAAKKLIRNKEINIPYIAVKTAFDPSTIHNDANDLQNEDRDLGMFIFQKENPQFMKQYNAFKLNRFPDLKTPEELNQKQFTQQREYIDYNIY